MRIKFKFWSVCRRILTLSKLLRAWSVLQQMLQKMLFVENPPGLWRLHCKVPEYFTRCFFQKQQRVLPIWVVYRLVIFLYFVATTVYTIVDPEIPNNDKAKYLIFLTNWAYVLQLIQFGYAFIITVRRYMLERKNPQLPPMLRTPFSYKIYWVLFTMVLPVSMGITVLFWSLIYDPKLYPVNPHNVIVHGCNSGIMLLDFFLVGFPIRICYIVFPDLFIFVYVIFNVVYYASGGTGTKGMKPIYKILDWSEPLKALNYCMLGFFVIDFIYGLLWLLSLLKENLRPVKR